MTYPSKKTFKQLMERLTPEQKHQKIYYQYKDMTNPKPPVKPLDILKQKKGLKTAQIVPMKTTVLGPDIKPLSHIDWRGLGEKLRSVKRQKDYMDDTGRTPPKIP